MNYNNWSLQKAIQEQVQKESTHDWAKTDTRIPTPKVEIIKIKTRSAGFINLLKELTP